MKKTLKAISPLIASILLIVVAVILVTIILAFGKGFTTDALDKTQGLGDILPSDATHFIFPKAYEEGTIQFTYSPPSSLQEKTISITSYQILELPDVAPITLTTPYTLKEGTNTLPLNCLYEHALSSPDFTIQLITEDNTYITIKQRDAGMVCTSTGDGSEATPKIICSAEDLNNVRNNLDANYSLGKNIDLGCFLSSDINGWVPIGNSTNRFKGSFDGQNHMIDNLYINRPSTDNVGFFGFSEGTQTIQNLGFNDVNVVGDNTVGGLAGYQLGGSIINCHVTGTIYSKGTGMGNAGVLVGVLSTGTVSYCYTTGLIFGKRAVGGLIGNNVGANIVQNSYSSAHVYGDGSEYAGGLVGANDTSIIINSFATGDVSGSSRDIGGLVGVNCFGNIDYSFATGAVDGNENVGGLVGWNMTSDSNVTNNYTLSSVTGLTNVGGFVGKNIDYSGLAGGNIINGYSTGIVSGDLNVGGFIGYNTGAVQDSIYNSENQPPNGYGSPKTIEQMKTQSTFAGWDFSTVWAINPTINEGYPYLRNNPPR